MVLGVSLGVFGLYYMGLIAGEPLAQRGTLSPFWAMWASNIYFHHRQRLAQGEHRPRGRSPTEAET